MKRMNWLLVSLSFVTYTVAHAESCWTLNFNGGNRAGGAVRGSLTNCGGSGSNAWTASNPVGVQAEGYGLKINAFQVVHSTDGNASVAVSVSGMTKLQEGGFTDFVVYMKNLKKDTTSPVDVYRLPGAGEYGICIVPNSTTITFDHCPYNTNGPVELISSRSLASDRSPGEPRGEGRGTR